MAKDRTWEEAIEFVLRSADRPLHYAAIAERITEDGLKEKVGANPVASVAAILSKSIKDPTSPFQRLGGGEYALKTNLIAEQAAVPPPEEVVESESETGSLKAFGMFWRRDHVLWSGKPRLFGRQGLGASQVNFSEQVGVYLLHDRERVIYVGRATDNLYARLKAHTTDRLGGRWDRFSWFGLRPVSNDGELGAASVPWHSGVVIETMEALLIESLEPPLNRKRGDNLAAAEYLQVLDPELEKLRKRSALAELMKSAEINA